MENKLITSLLSETQLEVRKENIKRIHVVEASRIPKIFLIEMIYGYNDMKYINPDIPEEFWIENGGKCHSQSHVMDSRLKTPTNLINKGIQKKIIFKTI